MMALRERIAVGFENWARLIVRWRWLVIALVLLLSAGLGMQLRYLRVDNSVEVFLHANDPVLLRYNQFRNEFGRDDVVAVAIRPPKIFDLAFLDELRRLHRDLEAEVPYLDEVTSLVNARSTRGERDELIVEDLLETWPRNAADLAALEERVFANPLYVDSLISRDGRFTVVAVKPVTYSPGDDADELAGFDGDAEVERGDSGHRKFLDDRVNALLVKAVREVMRRLTARGRC